MKNPETLNKVYINVVENAAGKKLVCVLDLVNINFSAVINTIKSSQQRCSLRKGAPRNFAKFTGKHLC